MTKPQIFIIICHQTNGCYQSIVFIVVYCFPCKALSPSLLLHAMVVVVPWRCCCWCWKVRSVAFFVCFSLFLPSRAVALAWCWLKARIDQCAVLIAEIIFSVETYQFLQRTTTDVTNLLLYLLGTHSTLGPPSLWQGDWKNNTTLFKCECLLAGLLTMGNKQ